MAQEIQSEGAGFMEPITNLFGRQTTTVFGPPVERGGMTVIPVAKLRFGLGGGGGTSQTGDKGSGTGGGYAAAPVGFIEMNRGTAQYKAILDLTHVVTVFMGVSFGTWLILRGVSHLRKSRKASMKVH